MSSTHDLFELAQRHHQTGNWTDAERLYRQVLDADCNHLEAHSKLATVLYLQGNFKEAVIAYQQVLRFKPNDPYASYNVGLALHRLGRVGDAINHYRVALQQEPNFVLAWNNMGSAFKAMDKFDEAIICYQNALGIDPYCAEALGNLANVLAEQGKIEEAIPYYGRAVGLRPVDSDAHCNFGLALEKAGKWEEAATAFRRSVLLAPNSVQAQFNLGIVTQELGELDEALAAYSHVLRLQPDHAKAHQNQALIWLQRGDWTQGWAEYEWRWRTENFPRYFLPKSRWTGSPLEDRTLLLVAEQGLGDTLQFTRYVPFLQNQGSKVKVLCQRPLQRLLVDAFGSENVASLGGKLPDFDVHLPLLNVPGTLGTTPKSVPANIPYLCADPELVEQWRQDLDPLRDIRVGIAWHGNPTIGDSRRCVQLAEFACLARIPGIHLVSLQKGAGTEQLQTVAGKFDIVDLGDRLDNASGAFRDTAAIMKNLHLVISSDTAVPHLAGALGVPVWVALRHAADWRWFLNRDDSPWYPTMRLFRQSRPGDWKEVFERMAGELRAWQSSQIGSLNENQSQKLA